MIDILRECRQTGGGHGGIRDLKEAIQTVLGTSYTRMQHVIANICGKETPNIELDSELASS